ncbi:hypothetical protein DFJ73DRAFT_832176 [Zopfochytrium polystomum]|nr:hypothetical protein DFJ73DRAFT_832176 [Zopfochytrium polystomum]
MMRGPSTVAPPTTTNDPASLAAAPVCREPSLLPFDQFSVSTSSAEDLTCLMGIIEDARVNYKAAVKEAEEILQFLRKAKIELQQRNIEKSGEFAAPVSTEDALRDWPDNDSQYSNDYFICHDRSEKDHKLASELHYRLKLSMMKKFLNPEHVMTTLPGVRSNAKPFETVADSWGPDHEIVDMKRSKVLILLITPAALEALRDPAAGNEYLRRQWETSLIAQRFNKCIVTPIFIGAKVDDIRSSETPSSRCKALFDAICRIQAFVCPEPFDTRDLLTHCEDSLKNFSARNKKREELYKELEKTGNLWCVEKADFAPASTKEFEILVDSVRFNPNWVTLTINLKSKGLTFELSGIGASLQYNSNLKNLILSGNKLCDKDVHRLAKSLSENDDSAIGLTELDLSDNCIQDAGADSIFAALESVPIKKVNLRRNLIGEDGARSAAKILPRTSLEFLDISENNLCQGGLDIANVLNETKLVELRVGNNNIRQGDNFGTALSSNETVKAIDIASCDLSSEGLKQLQTNRTLEELGLARNEMLQSYKQMEALSTALEKGLKSLRVLRLDGIQLCDPRVMMVLASGISHCDTLTELYLVGCTVFPRVLSTLLEGISMNGVKLKTLDISENAIGDVGLGNIIPFFVKDGVGLTALFVVRCDITSAGAEQLYNVLQNVKVDIGIGNNPGISPLWMTKLSKLQYVDCL